MDEVLAEGVISDACDLIEPKSVAGVDGDQLLPLLWAVVSDLAEGLSGRADDNVSQSQATMVVAVEFGLQSRLD